MVSPVFIFIFLFLHADNADSFLCYTKQPVKAIPIKPLHRFFHKIIAILHMFNDIILFLLYLFFHYTKDEKELSFVKTQIS